MRIIAGLFKGRKIYEPKDKSTRPLKDLTKESVFNILHHSNKFKINLKTSVILDIFSGVGSFGLECLSRGAKKVIFIENHKYALDILNKNLANLKIINNYEILKKNAYEITTFKNISKKFDLIFLDPPYKDKNIETLLNNIFKENILKTNGIVILHRHKNANDIIPSNYTILEEKKIRDIKNNIFNSIKLIIFLFLF